MSHLAVEYIFIIFYFFIDNFLDYFIILMVFIINGRIIKDKNNGYYQNI